MPVTGQCPECGQTIEGVGFSTEEAVEGIRIMNLSITGDERSGSAERAYVCNNCDKIIGFGTAKYS